MAGRRLSRVWQKSTPFAGDWTKAAEHALKSLRKDADNLQARNLATIALRMSSRGEQRPTAFWRNYEAARPARHRQPLPGERRSAASTRRWHWILLSILRDAACSSEAIAILERAAQRILRRTARRRWCCTRSPHFAPKLAMPRERDEPGLRQPRQVPTTAFRIDWKNCSFWRARLPRGPTTRVRRTISAICFMLDGVTKTPSRCGNALRNSIRRSRSLGAISASRISILPETPRKRATAFEKAFAANPADSRVLYERDQLWKRVGERPEVRLAELERHLDLAGYARRSFRRTRQPLQPDAPARERRSLSFDRENFSRGKAARVWRLASTCARTSLLGRVLCRRGRAGRSAASVRSCA